MYIRDYYTSITIAREITAENAEKPVSQYWTQSNCVCFQSKKVQNGYMCVLYKALEQEYTSGFCSDLVTN